MRDVLKAFKEDFANMEGAVLVGSFPEATLVRRWLWKKTGGKNDTINGVNIKDDEYLRVIPEMVSHRADLVLADLDGNWEDIYVKGPTAIESLKARPADSNNWYKNGWTRFNLSEVGTKTFEDFFFIQDDRYRKWSGNTPNRFWVHLTTAQQHPEISPNHAEQNNPIARPDIQVSRINPLHIAVNPDPTITDANGKGFLNAAGRPQSLTGNHAVQWVRDPALERELLIKYFERNHTFRVGGENHLVFRGGAISYPEDDFKVQNLATYVDKARSDFATVLKAPKNPNLLDYVNFYKQPAVLRAVTAHSNAWNTVFDNDQNLNALETAVGNRLFRWKYSPVTNQTTPSLKDQSSHADLYLHRSMYEAGVLSKSSANLIIHNGCETVTPQSGGKVRYNAPNYGKFQNGEGQLFYLNGLALLGRAKVFYDSPRGLEEAFDGRPRAHFGDLWRRYFTKESQDAGLPTNVAGNKRTYNWSVLGDWSVRLRYDNGIGIAGNRWWGPATLKAHADQAWVDGGWNFVSDDNHLRGHGDFNGDGRDEAIVESDWGIGLLEHTGSAWNAPVVKPRDTWFGAWRYNAAFHNGTDTIAGTGDFDGDGRDEILITSEWGLGILGRRGSTLRSELTHADNTWANGWRYETHNKIKGIGDFNGDGRDDILVTSPWGIGILTQRNGRLGALVVKPHDTWFGAWRYSIHNTIVGVGDFNGDGKDDVVLKSGWGIGILRHHGNSFRSIVAIPNDTWLGSWRYNASFHQHKDRIKGIVDTDGDNKDELLIFSEWGMGLLEVSGDSMTALLAKPNGSNIGSWTVSTWDTPIVTGNFWNNNRESVVLKSFSSYGTLFKSGGQYHVFRKADFGKPNGDWIPLWGDKATNAGDFLPDHPGDEWFLMR